MTKQKIEVNKALTEDENLSLGDSLEIKVVPGKDKIVEKASLNTPKAVSKLELFKIKFEEIRKSNEKRKD
jgi:hypothetical protein